MTRFGLQSNGGRRIFEALDGRPDPVSPRTRSRRHRCLTCTFSIVAVLYAGRLGHLQLVLGDELRDRARAQSREERVIPASRGEIVDRNGQSLVADDTRYHAYLAPRELNDARSREEVMAAIEAVLDLPPARRARLASVTQGWQTIAAAVTDEERTRLVASIGAGLRFEPNAARRYPRGGVARRLIGSIDEDGVGRSGLELYLDPWLRGTAGVRRVRVDAKKGEYRSPHDVLTEARPGYDVTLTIDAGLQRIAETELARVLETTRASGGDIIIYDPRNGEILALASEKVDAVQDAVPAFSDPYEPGSTAKPFLLAALLNEGLVDLDESIDVEGGEFRDRFRVINDVHGFDELSVRDVIIQSSNVGAAKLSERLSASVQHGYLRDFGFGMPTRIGYPGESSGELRRPGEWSKLSAASLAMGYEMSTTSLQLVAAYGALANDGVLMRPTLIREVRDHEGRVIFEAEPIEVRRVVRSEVAREVTGVLEAVVRDGTAKLAGMARLAVAGKTGTARLSIDGRYVSGRYRASFVGYAPADDPSVVILTRLEDPKGAYYGGVIAAPTSQATLQAALATRVASVDRRLVASGLRPRRWAGATPDGSAEGPFIFAVGEGRRMWPAQRPDEKPSIEVPNLTGLPLRSAVARLHELGLRVEWRGVETVREQDPAPGRELTWGGTVVLR